MQIFSFPIVAVPAPRLGNYELGSPSKATSTLRQSGRNGPRGRGRKPSFSEEKLQKILTLIARANYARLKLIARQIRIS